MKVFGNIDLDEHGKINNAIVASGTSFPSVQESTIGELFFNTSINSYGLFYYDGDSWELIVGNKESNKRFSAFKSSDLTWINVKNKPVDDDGKIDASQLSTGTINIARLPGLPWANIINKPMTIGGYGIIDAAPISHTHPEFSSISRIAVPQTLGTAIIPYDNTVPLITEGAQILSTSYSPSSETATVELSTVLTVESNIASRYIIISLFRDSTCIGVRAQLLPTANASFQMPICFYDTPAANAMYTLRAGVHSAASWKINKNDGSTGGFGGVGQSMKYLKITEI